MFTRINSLLKSAPFRSKSSGILFALQVRHVASDALGDLISDLPREILDQIRVKSFKNGVLTIVCPSIVASELYMRSEELKKTINKGVGGSVVGGIKFKSN